jgi:lipid-binding SYLF domain-containing protein
MNPPFRIQPFVLTFLVVAVMALAGLRVAQAAPELSLDGDAKRALTALYESSPDAKALGANAKAVLVFPGIQKIGLIFGAQFGEGALFKDGTVIDYYRLIGVLGGLEAGIQSFAYAVFFMSDAALEDMQASSGFAIGTDPNIVIIDAGVGKEISTNNLQADVYGYVFKQKGLMGGIALQGVKITRLGR